MNVIVPKGPSSREHLLHALYEAAELEHNLMCTYLYAAYSLKDGVAEGLAPDEAEAVASWRRTIIEVAIEEMGHLTAVWNITSALGGTPRFGRANFPLDIGYLPAGIVVKLAPFSETTLQHFIFLERPEGSDEPDGDGFVAERNFSRASPAPRLVPTAMDYDTVGEFYEAIAARLRAFVADVGEDAVFCGDPALQLSPAEMALKGIKPVKCLKTALAAFDAIVLEGEGAREHSDTSHFQRFVGIRTDYPKFKAKNPDFAPAHPAATNPVLRRPPRPEGRVWIETPAAVATVDLANAAYGLTLRLLANSYAVPAPDPEKALSTDLATGLMRATTLLGEHAARLPAGPTHPECNAGISFTALRDSSPLPPGPAARRFFVERLADLAHAAEALNVVGDKRTDAAARMLAALSARATRGFTDAALTSPVVPAAKIAPPTAPAADTPKTTVANGIEIVEGKALQLRFEAKRCIHARFCVTGAPDVFLANVKGPWLHPDAMDVERLVDIANMCPSGAIQYTRKDGRPDEQAPLVNLAAIREAGPYAFHGALQLDGVPIGMRATLCRCGASKNKPFCDSSHHDVGFAATGEPPTTKDTDMLPVRDGPLAIDPLTDGPLSVRGNLEITSGTGRVVARIISAKLCRCGASNSKPFCDGSHVRVGFKSI